MDFVQFTSFFCGLTGPNVEVFEVGDICGIVLLCNKFDYDFFGFRGM